jgi:hypothetical protein
MADCADLCFGKAAALLQGQHHRSCRLARFADEDAGFGHRQMDPRGLYSIDSLDGARQIGFARPAQGFAFDRAA